MFTALVLASGFLSQCSGGSCSAPGFAQYRPSFNFAPPLQYQAPVAPALYQLSDSAGQAFTHSDPVFLQSWIVARNAKAAAATAVVAKPAVTDLPHPLIGMAPPASVATSDPALYGRISALANRLTALEGRVKSCECKPPAVGDLNPVEDEAPSKPPVTSLPPKE